MITLNDIQYSAPPPPGFYIDGDSEVLPHRYRISFDRYGSKLYDFAAQECLEKVALEMHRYPEKAIMGDRRRLWGYGGVVLSLDPRPGMTWGYWGALIRAFNSMWTSWDIIALDFVIDVEDEGELASGFLAKLS